MEHREPFITSSSSPSAFHNSALEDQQHPQKASRRRHPLSRKRIILLAVFATLIIVALAVGLGVGLTRRRNNSSNSNTSDAGSSIDPSKPSISNSSVPSDQPITAMGVTPSRNGLWQPPVNASWQIVLSSPLQLDLNSHTIEPNVDVWDIDMFTNSKETIDHLHNLGKRVVCYFSAGSYEPNRPDSSQFQASDKGGELNGWPGEYWLKLSSPSVRSIMANRVKVAFDKGCDAIDPDNVDGYSNSENGHGLTEQDSIDFINFISDEAKQYNISVGLKNAGAIIPNVLDKVHFAVNEQCVEYGECTVYSKFIDNSKPVFHIEYPKGDTESNDNAVASTESNTVCNKQGQAAGTNDFSTTIKNMNLDGWVEYCNGALAVTPCTGNGGKGSSSGTAPSASYGSSAPEPAPVSYSSAAVEAPPASYSSASPEAAAPPTSYGSDESETTAVPSPSPSVKPTTSKAPNAYAYGVAKAKPYAPSSSSLKARPSHYHDDEEEEPKSSYQADEEDEDDDEEDEEDSYDDEEEENDDDEEDDDEDDS